MIFLVLFSKILRFIKKNSSSEKKVIFEEELDCVDIDDIGNLEDSPRLVFINEECGNLTVVNGGGEPTENINRKRQMYYDSLLNVHSVTNVVGGSISSVTCGIFIVKQLGKHNFSCDFLNIKDRNCLFDQMNISLYPIFAMRDWSCSTIENLRCLNFAVT